MYAMEPEISSIHRSFMDDAGRICLISNRVGETAG